MIERDGRWIHAARITRKEDALVWLFWFWGLGGLLFIGVEFLILFNGRVGIGTSGYVTAHCLFWIGGLLLFGVGALIRGRLETNGPIPVYVSKAPARARGYDDEFNGAAFKRLEGGQIEGEIGDKAYRFSNWKEFVDAVNS